MPSDEKILLAGYLTPHADKRARAVELWQAIADDVRETEQGKISIELYEDVEQEKGGYLVLEEFASEAISEAYKTKPFHAAISTKVYEEKLIEVFRIGYYTRVLGVSKPIGGGQHSDDAVLMAVFVTVNEGRTEQAVDLWKSICEDVGATEGGNVAMELYHIHEEVGGDGEKERFLLIYEFADEAAREAFGKKPSHQEAIAKEQELKLFKSVDIKVCKHVLGSGSGVGAL